ncbi:hypothetical protein ACFULT_26330 [Rhodococcus sp. NPDC057297]|uniref:hypothetical protein n=1 Tax=Rhodococcus sp. NPDC057297 TaxID=3346090 RepID=UPI00362663FB
MPGSPRDWHYEPNHSIVNGMGAYLRGPDLRSMMREYGEIGLAMYRENAIKRSGLNARSSRSYTEIGGAKNDRWTAVVLAYGPYAAAREFGNSRNGPESNLRSIIPKLEELEW